jgi:DNA modification methylase
MIIQGDCRAILPTLADISVHCVVTSPPYWGLRDYGVAEQIGLEATPAEYVEVMVAVFREVRRVLRDDGTVWVNLGDSYAAERGGTAMPAETLHGGIGGIGDDVSRRGRKNGFQAHRKASAYGLKHKDLCGIPWRVAFALQADGWYLRQDIIWSKPNPMPESVRDRCTKAHEYIFMLSKSERYYYDAEAIREENSQDTFKSNPKYGTPQNIKITKDNPKQNRHSKSQAGILTYNSVYLNGGRNKRSVWEVATAPFSEAHFATFPPALIEPCILAGCPKGGTVLDPFGGAGTTGLVADRLGRNAILIELNSEYATMAERRIIDDCPLFAGEINADRI